MIFIVIEVLATKNVIKDKMAGRVDIFRRIFEKIAKKSKLKSKYPKKHNFKIFQEINQKRCFPVL